MHERDKEKWDEIIGGIDEKFTAEAAEMLHGKKGGGYGHPEIGVEIKMTEKRRRKSLAVWGISAAAVVVAAAGAAVVLNFSGRIDVADQARSTAATTSGVTLYKSDSGSDSPELLGINAYNVDFDVFEEYFVGKWLSRETDRECTFSYVGSSIDPGFFSGLYSVYGNDKGRYMMFDSGEGAQVYFIPSDDGSCMYLYDCADYIVDRSEYSDVFDRIYSGSDEDREITVGNYLSAEALCRLDYDLNGALTTVFGDVYGTVFNDNEDGKWLLAEPSDECYRAPLLVSRDSGDITLGLAFANADTDAPRTVLINVSKKEDGSWGWNATDADGRAYFTGEDKTPYSEAVELYRERFMGEWENTADPSEKFTLSYTEDFFEKGISRYIGHGSNNDGIKGGSVYLLVRSENDDGTGVVPYFSGKNVKYLVYNDEPDMMYCIPDGSGEPYAVYRRTGTASYDLPERGEVSQLGMYSVVMSCGDDLPQLFCNTEARTECEGTVCVSGGAPYYILCRESDVLAVMMDYTAEGSDEEISVVTTFVRREDGWHAAKVEKAVDMNETGVRTEMTSDGCYYLTSEHTDGGELLRVFFYRSDDGIMYELNADGRDGFRLYDAVYLCDGDALYVLGTADGEIRLAEYSCGERKAAVAVSAAESGFTGRSLSLSDGYIRADWTDGTSKTAVIDPNDITDFRVYDEFAE